MTRHYPEDEQTSLMIMQQAEVLLFEADTIQKAKELKNLLITAAEWAKRRKLGTKAVQYAQSYALEAERKMGQMLQQTERAKGGGEPGVGRRGKRNAITSSDGIPDKAKPTLKDLGITANESAKAQQLADLPKDIFEAMKRGETTRKEAVATFKPAPAPTPKRKPVRVDTRPAERTWHSTLTEMTAALHSAFTKIPKERWAVFQKKFVAALASTVADVLHS